MEKMDQRISQWIIDHNESVELENQWVSDVHNFAREWVEPAGAPAAPVEDPDEVNPIYAGQSERVKALKKKSYWKYINPLYRAYANVKVGLIVFSKTDKKTAFVQWKNKKELEWKNRRSVVLKRNEQFLKKILSEEDFPRQRSMKFSKDIKISVIVPLYNTPEVFLKDMIESVQKQTYANWELCLGDGSDAEHAEVEKICRKYAAKDSRIIYKKLEKNEGISGNTNQCLKFATGEYVALFDHDDMLHPSALFKCMEEIDKNGAELIYTDEMTFDHDSIKKIVTLHFKPAFSPQTLNGVNYICHLCVFKRSLLAANGLIYDDRYDGSQDHDMILRLTAATKKVAHIPEILYFWRIHPQSVSMNISAKSYAIDAGRRAVHDSEARKGREADIYSACICATHYRFEYKMKEHPLANVIIVNKDQGKALAKLIDSIVKRTGYDNYRIIVADLGSTDHKTTEFLDILREAGGCGISVETAKEGETVSAFLNRLVAATEGDYFTFLESNMEILDTEWLRRLVMYAMQDEIGIVGSRFIDQYGMLMEAGYITGLGEDGIALPVEHKNAYTEFGYMGRMYYVHNVGAVSIWGMMIRKNHFEELHGFQEGLQTGDYLGIDLSLNALKHGLQVILHPYIINMQHKEALEGAFSQGQTKEYRTADQTLMKTVWKEELAAGDPYYNKNLNRDGSFTFAENE